MSSLPQNRCFDGGNGRIGVKEVVLDNFYTPVSNALSEEEKFRQRLVRTA
jgi:hypothetical protein